MSTPETTREPGGDCCRKLRWKGMYVEAEHDPTVPSGHSGVTWCALTQRVLGPDGEVVGARHCVAGRTCHVS